MLRTRTSFVCEQISFPLPLLNTPRAVRVIYIYSIEQSKAAPLNAQCCGRVSLVGKSTMHIKCKSVLLGYLYSGQRYGPYGPYSPALPRFCVEVTAVTNRTGKAANNFFGSDYQ